MSTELPIFVSTSGVRNGTAIDCAKSWADLGVKRIELSGGKHVATLNQELAQLADVFQDVMLHNYFPPPEIPFVLNLASIDANILEKSLSLAKEAIDKSSLLNSKFYGVHAGFLFDPRVEHLGHPIPRQDIVSRNTALNQFHESIRELSKFATQRGVQLLVENNVLSQKNFDEFGTNPFLLVELEEILDFTNKSDVGLLLDVGHLNVSCQTLKSDRVKAMELLSPIVDGYHLSDNDGSSDQHAKLTPNSWFVPFLDFNAKFMTLEIHSQMKDDVFESLRVIENVVS